MFRQIRVIEDHTRFQMILWRSDPQGELESYRLETITYGTASAPYLALRVLDQLARDDEAQFPLATSEIPSSIYVDDALFGASTLDECIRIRDEMIGLLASCCLQLRKWSANDSALLLGLPPEHCEMNPKSFQEDTKLRVIGTSWNPHSDRIYFPVHLESLPKVTKRTLFSQLAKLFDPLGLVSPVVVTGKIFIQKLWLLDLQWDDALPSEIVEKWQTFYGGLIHLSRVEIPRWIDTLSDSALQVHGFCDASQYAYASVVYLRVQTGSKVYVHLLCSKTRVAPVKQYVTVPRLELCGADILSKLLQWCYTSLELKDVPVFAWSDSSVTLHWLSSYPARWKVFIANRVSAIQSRSLSTDWRYVPTADNPADLASRGVSAIELSTSKLWWHGPDWLAEDQSCWPNSIFEPVSPEVDLEIKPILVHVALTDEWSLDTQIGGNCCE